MRLSLLVFAALASCTAFANHSILRTLDPALSPDGKQIAFSWQGDIWVGSSTGGNATRLTVNPAPDESPIWSPDGQFIYFSSSRFGPSNLFRMKPDGSDLKRLTYESAATYATSISPDGQTIYGYTTAFGRSNLFKCSANGGELIQITGNPLETQFAPDISPDGKTVVFCEGGSAGEWRKPGLRGSNTPEFWTGTAGAPLTNLKRLTNNDVLDMYPRYVGPDKLLEMSNRSGSHNLWFVGMDGKPMNQITHFMGGTIRAVTVNRDGTLAAFQRNSQIYTADLATGKTMSLDFYVPDDSRRPATTSLSLITGASQVSVSQDGKRAIISLRGDLFEMPTAGGTTRQLTTNPNWDGDADWIDGKSAVYVAAGDNGKRELHVVNTDGVDKVLISGNQDMLHPTVSPDRKSIAFLRGEHEIVTIPAAGGTPQVAYTGRFLDSFDGPRPFNWSPDSTNLVVSSANERNGFDIVLVSLYPRTETLLTRIGKSGNTPWFYPNSKGVFFIGLEGLDYDEAGQTGSSGLYAVDFQPDPVTFTEDDLDKLDEPPAKPAAANHITVDMVGLKERKHKVLADVSNAWPGIDGNTIYAATPAGLVKVGGPTWKSSPVAPGPVDDLVAAKGRITYISQGKVFNLSEKGETAPAPFNARLTIDNKKEDMALFNEAWWALDRMYYDAKHHGKNWDAIRTEFAGYVPEVTSRDDFYNLMGEMVERLDSSHQGANTSDPYRPDNAQPVAWLGVQFDPAMLDKGRYFVSQTYSNGPAANPSSKLNPLDEIVAVNGIKLLSNADHSAPTLSSLLVDQIGKKVRLSVIKWIPNTAIRGLQPPVVSEVIIKPVSPAAKTPAYYQDWVERNRAEVEKLSGDKLAYIHIAAMDTPSLDRFLTDIQDETIGKKGVIVDVRFNGGGFTAHIILNIMRKNNWLKRTFRDNPNASISENIMRGNSLEMPAACLANQFSYSNAEIFSEGFRRLGLGPVVGEPTAGAVIGTGAHSLWDGGSIRMPAIGVYTVDGEDLEQHGRQPNVFVPYDPVAWMNGNDKQIEAAVKELMKEIK